MATLTTAEDLQWLRDTIPAVRPYVFALAIIDGNEDFPSRIVLAERDHVDAPCVVLTRRDGDAGDHATDYRVSMHRGYPA